MMTSPVPMGGGSFTVNGASSGDVKTTKYLSFTGTFGSPSHTNPSELSQLTTWFEAGYTVMASCQFTNIFNGMVFYLPLLTCTNNYVVVFGGSSCFNGDQYCIGLSTSDGGTRWYLQFSGIDIDRIDGLSSLDIVNNRVPNPCQLTFIGATTGTYDGSEETTINIPSIPASLKNPASLTFTGAVSGIYDGSNAVTINIPESSGSGSGAPEYAESIAWLNENGDASKMYVLPDGYIYAKRSSTSPDFINLFDSSKAALNSIRTGANGGTLTNRVGIMSTGLIPVACRTDSNNPVKIRIRGAKLLTWIDDGDKIVYYDASGAQKWYAHIKKVKYEEDSNGDVTIYAGWSTSDPIANCDTNYKQFSISIHIKGEVQITADDIKDVIITVDQPITYSSKQVWTNTGISYSGTSVSDTQIEEVVNKISPFKDKKVLILGDSISTDTYGNYAKWVTVLKNQGFFPSSTVNDSIHATGFVARYTGEDANAQNSFVQRIQAVENKESFDLVVIFGGINDYIQNVEMGGDSGKTDKATYFKPAVDWFFEYVVKNFVQARIVVLAPLRTYNVYKNTAGGSQATGHYQTEYADYIKTVAKKYCLPVLNLTEESGFCPFIQEFRTKWTLVPTGYSADGVHPNKDYSEKYLAPMIKHFLSGMM